MHIFDYIYFILRELGLLHKRMCDAGTPRRPRPPEAAARGPLLSPAGALFVHDGKSRSHGPTLTATRNSQFREPIYLIIDFASSATQGLVV